jgi:peptidoglycan/xylan/chitin deacetylase (PgdA/CDA1 family)
MAKTKEIMKEAFAELVVRTGIARMARTLVWRDRVAILLYHDPRPDTLDRHLSCLRKVCDIVPLKDALRPGSGRPRAAITIDDGNIGNADLLPVFIRHNVRPTIYLCSGVVGRRRRHWWLHPEVQRVGVERLKRLTNTERLALLEQAGFRQDGDDEATGLTVEQLEAMRPYVDFQAHTRFHPILTRCSDSECEEEIAVCKRELEALLGQTCEHFAYPNGNYGEREVHFVKAAGYKTARTCDIGWANGKSDPFRLPTIHIDDGATTRWFAAQLTGIPMLVRYLREGSGWGGRFRQF